MATKKSEAAALRELKALGGPGAPMPGAAPAALPGRQHGRYATATVAGVTLHLFDWSVDFELETFDATAHGERHKVYVPGDQRWTARARGYFTPSVASYLAASAHLSADPGTVVFTGYRNMTINPTDVVWAGPAHIIRANFSAPMAMITQELELQGSGPPTDISI